MTVEHNNDLYWHALNYRTAATGQAEAMWLELKACVERLKTAAELRDQFAAAALPALMQTTHMWRDSEDEDLAEAAYWIADAMLKVRQK
jgi:hypothetical protein